MNQNKNARGQQNQGQKNRGRQKEPSQGSKDLNWNETPQSSPNPEPREGERGGQSTGNRDNSNRDNTGGQERGTGSQGEKNSSGISNRGMDRDEEQADLPGRGSGDRNIDDDSSDQSKR